MKRPDVVTVRGLCKRYGERTVVEAVDLDVAPGEIVGLIGANGAGKTTTVECIQGLRRADGGTLCVLGLDPGTQSDRLRPLIGSQLQDSALPDRLRVGEAVELFGGRRGEELLAQFGLADRRRSAFASLSGGEAPASLPRPCAREPTAARHPRRAHPGPGSGRPSQRVGGGRADPRQRDRRVARHPRVGRGGAALRPGGGDARRTELLDSGPPADLIDRYGRDTTIAFRLAPEGAFAGGPPRLEDLPGVKGVAVDRGRVTVRGDRTAIAHVGAALLRSGWVPPDLRVHVPTLEDALLDLLDRAADPDPRFPVPQMIGAF